LKLRLNQLKKRFRLRPAALGVALAWATGLSRVAHRAGVRIRATSTDRAMAETMVIENWR
jgi:branched-subunit amino acid ABC-type transport system permease component